MSQNLHEQIECTRKEGIMDNFEKCFIRPNVAVFDNLYSSEGIKPDMKKVEGSKQMQTPINKQMSLLLGIVNHLFYYMPNSSYLTSNLRGLLKKDALFQWSEAHVIAF